MFIVGDEGGTLEGYYLEDERIENVSHDEIQREGSRFYFTRLEEP
jgi:hypothetical protein